LYGTYTIYDEVRKTGCDPTGQVPGNKTCHSTGAAVFAAMLGISFAGQGLSQVADFIEAFTAARTACYPALVAIKRTTGSLQGNEKDIVLEKNSATDKDMIISKKDAIGQSSRDESMDVEQGDKSITARLPKYEIDSFSDQGLKPAILEGSIAFEKVNFSYPYV
jgi:ATP-binding cassette subfamily B (MDR/TAP) protein 1